MSSASETKYSFSVRASDILFYSLWILLGLFSTFLIYLATRWGAGLTPDSITYISGARSILQGKGLTNIGNHYPPFYFIVLGISFLIAGNSLETVRLLHVSFFGITVLFSGFLVFRQTDGCRSFTIIAMILVAMSLPLFLVFSMCWSEPLFFICTLAGFYFLSEHLSSPDRKKLFYGSCWIGLAFLTRYAGITLLITGCLALLLFRQHRIDKLKDTLLFLLVTLLPMIMWFAYGSMKNSETPRTFAFHPVSAEKINSGLATMSRWFFIPEQYSYILAFILLIVVLLHLAVRPGSNNDLLTRRHDTAELALLFIPVYLLFIVVSISFFDAHTPLDNRILSPVYLAFIIATVLVFNRVVDADIFGKKIKYVFFCIALSLAFANIPRLQKNISSFQEHGIGYASKGWATSETLAFVSRLPEETKIYTNGPDPIHLLLNRKSTMIPRYMNPSDRTPNPQFRGELRRLASEIREKDAVLVYFHTITWRWYLPPLDFLFNELQPSVYFSGYDGIVLGNNKKTIQENSNGENKR